MARAQYGYKDPLGVFTCAETIEREREEENKLEEDYSSTSDLNNTVSYVSLHAADLEA